MALFTPAHKTPENLIITLAYRWELALAYHCKNVN